MTDWKIGMQGYLNRSLREEHHVLFAPGDVVTVADIEKGDEGGILLVVTVHHEDINLVIPPTEVNLLSPIYCGECGKSAATCICNSEALKYVCPNCGWPETSCVCNSMLA